MVKPGLVEKLNAVILFLVALLITASCSKVPGDDPYEELNKSTFYIDSQNGNDSYSGRSPQKAWASLDKVNGTVFKPGDNILFRAGSVWGGQLEFKGSGAAGSPIRVNRYGEGRNPVIHGQGVKLHTVLLNNVEYWELRNLEITNSGKVRQAGRRGVIVSAWDFGDVHHIVLDSLEIHHVNGSLVKSEGGGGSAILWSNGGTQVKTRFIGLYITNNYLHNCARNGINSRANSNTRRSEWHPSLDVVIRNNLLEKIPGDGIVPIGTDGALIEYNVMRDSPDILSNQEAAAGIWPWSSDNTIIQFNEVSGHKAKWDGQGFDSDWNCLNTIIQYNYSHDNYGGFLLVCNNGNNINTDWNIGTANTIVRYNVSINDGIRPYQTTQRGWFSPVIHISGPVSNTQIYNNIIVLPEKSMPEMDRTIVEMDNWGGPWPVDTWFANNIFFVEGSSRFRLKQDINTLFTNNCYTGAIENMPYDPAAICADPQFVNAAARGEGFEILQSFMLKDTSPLKNSGLPVMNNGGRDFFGNILGESVSIGIYK
jgi:hypothetical protein